MTRLCALFLISLAAFAADTAEGVRRVLADQQAAWNRADIESFMQGYDRSPNTTFIGKAVVKGYDGVLANYRKNYASAEAMGKLNFDGIEVNSLGKRYAMVTGRFHLQRTQAGGGEAQGVFSLLFERKRTGWKIILDHTS